MNSRDMAICLRYIVFYRIWFCLWRFLSQCTGDLRETAIECCNFVCHYFLTFRQKTAGYDILRKEHSAELTEYGQIRTKVLELYSSGHIPTVESLDKKINALIQERSLKDQQFREADKRARDLADAQRTIEEFLRQERNEQQQDRKRKKNGDLE